jgi:hypothetical protein
MQYRWRFLPMLVVLVLASGCGNVSHSTAPQMTTESAELIEPIDWSGYPETTAFESFRHAHDSPEGWSSPRYRGRGARPILAITWFLSENANAALRYAVLEDGEAWDSRDIFDWAVQDTRDREIDAAQLRELNALLAKLPRSVHLPPLRRLVIVSRRVGTWRTDVYDSEKLPPEMVAIMRIVGERYETLRPQQANPSAR